MYIRGENIELRAIERSDYKKLAEILCAPQVAQRLFGQPSKLKEMAFSEWFSSIAQNRKDFYFTVKETGDFDTVGICAYQDIDYRNGSVTVWVALASEDMDKDYGSQTLKALTRNAFDQLRMEYVALYCLENDSVSEAHAKSAGFSFDALLYSRIKRGDIRLNLELYNLLKEEVKL